MPNIGLRTHKLRIERLKGIRELDEISFEDKPLTGIFGPNGIGKSTILQALATAYSAPQNCSSLHYKQFFPPLSADVWNGTRFTVDHTFRAGDAQVTGAVTYKKGTVSTQWTPTINGRPQRHVTYVGVKSCLPDLEAYSSHNLTDSVATPAVADVDIRVREAAGMILNCSYSDLSRLAAMP